MIGPKNKILGKDFLTIVIDYLIKESENHDSVDISESYYCTKYINNIYDSFLKKNPFITYNNENFYIRKICISDKPLYKNIKKTYKYKWDYCDRSKEIYYQSDESNESDNEKIISYSLDILKNKNITYNGSYLSQPMSCTSISGAQFYWTLDFNYILSIFLQLGSKRIINEKNIYGHGV